MKKPLKFVFSGICLILGTIFFTGILLAGYLNTDAARIQFLKLANQQIHGNISIQNHRISLLKGAIEIRNVRITDLFQEEIASCEHLSIDFSWFEIFQGFLRIQNATLKNPQINLAVSPEGILNVSRIFPARPQDLTQDSRVIFPAIVIDTVIISGTSFSYVDLPQNLSIHLENMEADLSADLMNQTGSADIRIGNGQISAPFLHTLLGPVSIKGNYQKGDILPLNLNLLSPGLDAKISGSISDLRHTPRLDLKVNIDSELSELRKGFYLETSLSGQAHISGTISGPLLNPNAELDLTSSRVKFAEYSLEQLCMAARLDDRVISLDATGEPPDKGTIHIKGSADLKQAFASGIFLPPPDLSALSGNMQVVLDSVSLDRVHPTATGVVSGTLAMQGTGYPDHAPTAGFGIDLQAARVSVHPDINPVDIRINSRSQWDNSGFQVQRFIAQAGATRLTASGRWNPSDSQISGDLTCHSDNLSKSLSPLGIRHATGSLDFQTRLSGTLKRPEFTLKIKGSRLGFGQIHIGNLEADAALGPSGMLRILTLSLKNQTSELTAKGEVPLYSVTPSLPKPYAFTAAFRQIQPDHFLQSSGVQGIIDGSLKVEGTEKSLSGTLNLQTEDLKVQNSRIGNVTAEFQLSDGKVQIQRLLLQNRSSRAAFSGNIQLFEPGTIILDRTMPFRLSGSATDLSAEDFTDLINGKLSIDVLLEGMPGQIAGSATLRSKNLSTGQKTFSQKFTTLDLTADFKDNKLNITRAHAAVAPGEFLDASGWLALDRTFQFTLSADGISLDHLNALADNWPAGKGKLFLNLTGNGHLDHPRIQGEIVLNPFQLYESNWDHTRIQLQIADDLARFQIQSQVQGMLSYQFQTRDYAADLNFIKVELSPFFRSAGLTEIGGTVSGKLSAAGNTYSLKTLKADAGFSELLLNAKEIPVIEGRDLHFGIQNEAIVIPQNRLTLFKDGTLDIGGQARPGQSVSLRLHADIPIKAASHFNDALSDLRGNLTISARMKGPWYSPDTEAIVDIRNAGLFLVNSSQDIHGVNGRIYLTPKAIVIDSLEGRLDNGHIALKGKAQIEAYQIQSMDFQMTASLLPVNIVDTVDAKLNADLTLQGTGQAPLIQGEIVVLEGLYYKDVSLNPLKTLFRRERGFQARKEVVFPAVIQNTLLDIRIPPRNLFVVDNNLAQLNLSPDMRITGTLQHPIILGRTRVDSGSLQYQSTTFTIKKGFIDFTNPYTLESVLDIQSQAAIQNWTVFLDISGPLDNLNLKLSSSPFLDDNDLLSLLVTGKTSRAAISKTSDSSGSSQKMLADLLSASIGSDLKKASGLDILEVDSTGERRHVNDDPLKVTFGKMISPRITLKYAVETKGGETFQRAITEYMFIENIIFSGFQDSRGVFGGEVKFRHEFR